MNDLLENHREELTRLCKEYKVARLELFGSATDDRFNAESSDLDFLVEFHNESPMGPFRQYFDFLAALEKLFDRKVDLVETNAMKNPYFIASAKRSKVLLYAA